MEGSTLLFYLGIGWLMAHELDAIDQHEWRVFPFTAPFGDKTGSRIFIAAHVPLLALILLAMPSRDFQIGFDVFLVGHAGLHFALRAHPRLEFRNWFSRVWIYGAAVVGVVHLVLLMG